MKTGPQVKFFFKVIQLVRRLRLESDLQKKYKCVFRKSKTFAIRELTSTYHPSDLEKFSKLHDLSSHPYIRNNHHLTELGWSLNKLT